jgi:transposase
VFFNREVSRILAYRHPVDMRKSFDGLIGLVANTLREDPLSGSLYVFTNRRRTYVKAVYWDRTGYCLFAKRLERGRFVLPGSNEQFELSEQAFRLLLDGIMLSGAVASCKTRA